MFFRLVLLQGRFHIRDAEEEWTHQLDAAQRGSFPAHRKARTETERASENHDSSGTRNGAACRERSFDFHPRTVRQREDGAGHRNCQDHRREEGAAAGRGEGEHYFCGCIFESPVA